jgi:hypothetical protein
MYKVAPESWIKLSFKSAICYHNGSLLGMRVYIRPRNNANVVRVPYSASNLSNKGVKANIFIKAWKKPACTRGKVFVLYTTQTQSISYVL